MILNIFGIKMLIENMTTDFTVGMYKISEIFYRSKTSGTKFNCLTEYKLMVIIIKLVEFILAYLLACTLRKLSFC